VTGPGPEYIDETHQRIMEFAAEFLDDDEEREAFVDGLLERRGYQRATHWTPPEPQQGGGKGAPLLRTGGRQAPARGGGQQQRGGGGSYFKNRGQ
jgi:hypothetical protein